LIILWSLSTSQIGGENFKVEESSGQGCGWLGREYDSAQMIEGSFSHLLDLAQQ